MSRLPDIGYPQTGDKVDSGFYACVNCPHTEPDDKSSVYLDKPQKLPLCPICGKTHWMKF
jgi:hypothetical protein